MVHDGTNGFVYVAWNKRRTFIKIGWTTNPKRRIWSIQRQLRLRGMSPTEESDVVEMPLIIRGTTTTENLLLDLAYLFLVPFKPVTRRRTEFFRFDDRVASIVESIAEQHRTLKCRYPFTEWQR